MARTPSRRRRPGTRRSTQRKGAPVRALRFARAPHEAVRPILNSATLLNEFLAKVVELTPEERALIVEQAIVLLEGCYAHLPLKGPCMRSIRCSDCGCSGTASLNSQRNAHSMPR